MSSMMNIILLKYFFGALPQNFPELNFCKNISLSSFALDAKVCEEMF